MQKILISENSLLDLPPIALTIGNFDGIHLGHRELIKQLKKRSDEFQVKSAVMTFDPHPIRVLRPEVKFKRLFSRRDQEDLLESMKIDYYIVHNFTKDLSKLTGAEFLDHILLKRIDLKSLIVGHDFTFGSNKSGNFKLLSQYSLKHNFTLDKIQPSKFNDQVVSSSWIRKELEAGNIENVTSMLCRPYYMDGTIHKGEQIGRSLGFPTLNVFPFDGVYPPFGVYFTKAILQSGQIIDAISNFGSRPTISENSNSPIVETHLLDFSGEEIYNQNIRIEFYKLLRLEKKFNNLNELSKQISKDVKEAYKFWGIQKSLNGLS